MTFPFPTFSPAVSSGDSFAVHATDSQGDSATGTGLRTFSGMSCGVASSGTKLLIIGIHNGGGTQTSLSSFTVSTATDETLRRDIGSSGVMQSLITATVPGSTTSVDIEATPTASCNGFVCAMATVTGADLSSLSNHDEASGDSLSLTVATGDLLFMHSTTYNVTSPVYSWTTPATEYYDTDSGSSISGSGAYELFASSGSKSASFTASGSFRTITGIVISPT